MAWTIAKKTGRPLHPDLEAVYDWPNTITYIVGVRMRYDSYLELMEVPREEIWDYPHLIREHIDKLYPKPKNSSTIQVDAEDIDD